MSEGESADAQSGTVIAQSIAPYTRVLVDTTVDLTICREQTLVYGPVVPLTVVVPLDRLDVRVEMVAPSGQRSEAYAKILDMGTHSVELRSSEAGTHSVYIYLDDVLFETLQLDFE